MNEEILKTFDLFIENAETPEFKELIKDIKEMYEENERLHSIIKEVREYIKDNSAFLNDDEWEVFNKKEIYEILDKVGDEK